MSISLTFDDGPDPVWTPAILRVLARCRATATFFLIGERVREHPEAARAALEAGHTSQLHCDRHIRHTECSEEEIEQDTRRGLAALAEIGVEPTHWRTPWGITTPASARVAERHGLQLVGWTIDTHDWRGDPAPTMLDRARESLVGGDVILMHDALGPGATREGCENTVELIPALLAAARARRLTPEALARTVARAPTDTLDPTKARSARGRRTR